MTKRADLLGLTADDLTTLSNAGLVKRARREADEAGKPPSVSEDDAGTVVVRWPDGVTCTLPAGVPVGRARCTCNAATLCRHVLRSVFAVQAAAAGDAAAPAPASAGRAVVPDDGTAARETPVREPAGIPSALEAKARALAATGLLVELARGVRPCARIHELGVTVRFLVPGDPRYARCDCGGDAPCVHAAIAMLAFERLAPGAQGGWVETAPAPAAPSAVLDRIEEAVLDLVRSGIAGVPRTFGDRLARIASSADDAALVWPAELIRELAAERDRHAAHDARFDPVRAAAIVGELLARCDAIRSDSGAVPQALVRGIASDRGTKFGKTRFVGLGTDVRLLRGRTEILACFQDAATGSVVALTREHDDPADGDAPPFAGLAARLAHQGTSLAVLAAEHVLADGAACTAGGRLSLGRSRVGISPQTFRWEELRAPVLAEGFAEVRARLAARPPAALASRRFGDDVHVVPVGGVLAAEFDVVGQRVVATLADARGGTATLVHPFTSRGAAGCEALLALGGSLCRSAEREPAGIPGRTAPQAPGAGPSVVFVSGRMRIRAGAVEVAPLGLVVEGPAGRTLLQPWVHAGSGVAAQPPAANPPGPVPVATVASAPVAAVASSPGATVASSPDAPAAEPWMTWLQDIGVALADALVTGTDRDSPGRVALWDRLVREGEACGLDRLVDPVRAIRQDLERRRHDVHADPASAARALSNALVVWNWAQT